MQSLSSYFNFKIIYFCLFAGLFGGWDGELEGESGEGRQRTHQSGWVEENLGGIGGGET